ncbi:MAG: Cof-type HAD-IIB family hydrolase [Firmicutes bacterium]|nr:Cof-type HAD-IIB family hydrolase [Bacillota bacterium]
MKYKLIASDLDGTLLNDASEVTAGAERAVSLAVGAGVRFAVVSGRSRKSLQRFEERLGLAAPGCYGIGFNGGLVYDARTREALLDRRLENAPAKEVLAALKELGADAVVYVGDRLLAERATPEIEAYAASSGLPIELVRFGGLDCPVSKLLVRGEPEKLTAIARHMAGIIAGKASMTRTSGRLLEFGDPDSHKNAGLEFLCARLGVSMGEVIAIGDNENDIPMIKAAGLGVAVANAIDAAKEAARYVTAATNNGDAVLEVVERFVMGRG